MKFLGKILVNTLAIVLAAEILPGIDIEGLYKAVLVALLLAVLNVTLKPLLIILTIPFTIVTFGLFLLAINAFIIMLAGYLIPGFYVDGFWYALLFSIVMAIINSILEKLLSPKSREPEQHF